MSMKTTPMSRRRFLGGAAAASMMGLVATRTRAGTPAEAPRQIKVGLVGCGGRGSWIASLFQQHGGYRFHAVADYFQVVADQKGEALGVEPARRFSGLSGYRRVIASGVEAVILETPPYFFPEHATAAVEAGLHVYMAKPVAVDVPGCLAIEAAAQRATRGDRVFLVDYQIPTEPAHIEIERRIRAGGLGKIVQVQTLGVCHGFEDPPLTATIESRLQRLTWVNDIAMGCDYIGNYDIHAIDAALWLLGERPVEASGASRIMRPDPHGDSRDVCSVVYRYASGVVHNHFGQGLKNQSDPALMAVVHGQSAYAQVDYYSKSFLRGGPQHYNGGPIENLYENGARRNIATFHQHVTTGHYANETVRRSVDGALACILGREAAARGRTLTMDELLRENRRLEVNLKGLKA